MRSLSLALFVSALIPRLVHGDTWDLIRGFDRQASCATILESFAGGTPIFRFSDVGTSSATLVQKLTDMQAQALQAKRDAGTQRGLPENLRAKKNPLGFFKRRFLRNPVDAELDNAVSREGFRVAMANGILELHSALNALEASATASQNSADLPIVHWLKVELNQFSEKALALDSSQKETSDIAQDTRDGFSKRLQAFEIAIAQLKRYEKDANTYGGRNPQFDNYLRAAARAKLRIARTWADEQMQRDDLEESHLIALFNLSTTFRIPMKKVMERFEKMAKFADEAADRATVIKIDGTPTSDQPYRISDSAVISLVAFSFSHSDLAVKAIAERYFDIKTSIEQNPQLTRLNHLVFEEAHFSVLTALSFESKLEASALVAGLLLIENETHGIDGIVCPASAAVVLLSAAVNEKETLNDTLIALSALFIDIVKRGDAQTEIDDFRINELASAKLAALAFFRGHSNGEAIVRNYLSLVSPLYSSNSEGENGAEEPIEFTDEDLVWLVEAESLFGVSRTALTQLLKEVQALKGSSRSLRQRLTALRLALAHTNANRGKPVSIEDVKYWLAIPKLELLDALDGLGNGYEATDPSEIRFADRTSETGTIYMQERDPLFRNASSSDSHASEDRGVRLVSSRDPDEGHKSTLDLGGTFMDLTDGSIGLNLGNGVRFDLDGDGFSFGSW
jgi:hypothetical protein